MNQNRFYQSTIVKWVFFIVLLLCVTVVSISILLFSWYEGNNVELYSEMTLASLLNTSRAIEALDNSLKSTGFLEIQNSDYAKMMNSERLESTRHGELQIKLFNLRLTQDHISAVYLVNKRADWIIINPPTVGIDAGQYSDRVRSLFQSNNAIVRIDTHKELFDDREEDVLSYVFFLTRSPHQYDSFLIIHVLQSDFSEALDAVDTGDGSVLMVLDSGGMVVLSREQDMLYTEYGNPEILRHIGSGGDSGYFVHGQGNGRILLSYVKCPATRFTYIMETPYSVVLSAANALRGRTLLLGAGILILGVFGAVLLAWNFYAPLRRLVEKHVLRNPQHKDLIASEYGNEYELIDRVFDNSLKKTVSMDSFISETLPIIRQDYLKKLLEGKIRVGMDLTGRILREVDISFEYEDFQVVILNLDNLADVAQDNNAEALKKEICDISQEAFSGVCLFETVWDIPGDHVVIILNYTAGTADCKKTAALLASVQKRTLAETGIMLTAAMGNVAAGNIRTSYKNALDLLLYKIKYDNGTLLTPDRIMGDIEGNNLFPEIECNQLIAALKTLSLEECERAIHEIVGKFFKYNMNDILLALNHILYRAFSAMRNMIKDKPEFGMPDIFFSYEMLMGYRSLHELNDSLNAFFADMVKDLRQALSGPDTEKSDSFEHILSFVNREFRNHSLSIDFVAAYAKLNPSYFGRVFFDNTGLHFTEYINRLRMEAAKELLTNTDESVNNIAKLVGFNSATYFITCFKKYTGVTPAKYR